MRFLWILWIIRISLSVICCDISFLNYSFSVSHITFKWSLIFLHLDESYPVIIKSVRAHTHRHRHLCTSAHTCTQTHRVQQVPGMCIWIITVTMPLLVSAFAWHLTPDAHTGSPPCCQAAGDSSSRWKTGGGWLWKNWWKMVVVVGIKTHSTWSYIKNLCLSAGVSQVRLEVGWRSTLPHAYFIDNGEEKEGKKKVKAQFEVARTIKSGEWIFTLKLWKATQM